MAFKFFLLAIFSLTILPLNLSASPGDLKLLKRERFTFENKDCVKNDSCDLKAVRYLIEDYRIELYGGLFNFGTRLFTEYETESIEFLEKYVFVSFVKGCAFTSELTDGEVNTSIAHGSGGPNSTEVWYPDWTIDSFDSDPAYNSYPGVSRNHTYRWNSQESSFDPKSENYYGIIRPTVPKLYVSDRPGTAFTGANGKAKNLSLVFKMCLYKSGDVPVDIANKDSLGEPIHCYQWASSWIYDHSLNRYTNPYGISDACQK